MKIVITAFVLLALVQWVLPARMIWEREEVLQIGKEFKFIVEPIDPEDPFKGRYINLNFKAGSHPVSDGTKFKTNERVFVLLEDSAGFARIKNIIQTPEPKNQHYVEAIVLTVSSGERGDLLWLKYPFEQFYMQEFKAPVAEEVYRKSLADSTKITYALVSVLNGKAVLKNVYVNDRAIGN